MTILELVQRIMRARQLPEPRTVVSNTALQVEQVLTAVNETAEDLMLRHPFNKQFLGHDWLADADGDRMGEPNLDTNEVLLDGETMRLGGIWRLLEQAGLEYAEPFRAYEERISRLAFRFNAEVLGDETVSL